MTKIRAKSDVSKLRGPLNGLIADHMRKQGIGSIKEFADQYNIGRSTIYDLVRGRSDGTISNPSLETITRVAEALNRPTHEILYLVNPHATGAEAFRQSPPSTHVERVPIYVAGCVGAGPQQLRETDDYIMVEPDFAHGRDLVGFRVVGDSMAGGRRPICHDDIVVVDRNAEAENNLPVVARLKGNGYVVKRLRSAKFLDSTNPDFEGPHAVVSLEDIDRLVGRVVRVQSSF